MAGKRPHTQREAARQAQGERQKVRLHGAGADDESDVILSGHGRVLAAAELGLDTIPARVIAGLTESQKRAYVIADNKLAQLSGWDGTLLRSELEVLIRDDFEIETTACSTAEIDILLDGNEQPNGTDPDDVQQEDVDEEVISRPGDLWTLGRHRIFCGDAKQLDITIPNEILLRADTVIE